MAGQALLLLILGSSSPQAGTGRERLHRLAIFYSPFNGVSQSLLNPELTTKTFVSKSHV